MQCYTDILPLIFIGVKIKLIKSLIYCQLNEAAIPSIALSSLRDRPAGYQ